MISFGERKKTFMEPAPIQFYCTRKEASQISVERGCDIRCYDMEESTA